MFDYVFYFIFLFFACQFVCKYSFQSAQSYGNAFIKFILLHILYRIIAFFFKNLNRDVNHAPQFMYYSRGYHGIS